MKKILRLFVVVLFSLVALCACGNNGAAADNKDNTEVGVNKNNVDNEEYFTWDELDDTCISGYTEEGLKQTELVIPAKCTKVYGLDDNATVKKISFLNPDTVVSANAFRDCTALEYIELPKNLAVLEVSVLHGCSSLKTVIIPEDLKEIKRNALAKCISLENVTLPYNIETIGDNAFWENTALSSISIPDSVKNIGEHAFDGCTALKTVEFGNGIETIGKYAFHQCHSLRTVKLNEGLKTVDEFAFAYCDNLEEIYFPSTVESMHSTAIEQLHAIKMYVKAGSWLDQKQASDFLGVEIEKVHY